MVICTEYRGQRYSMGSSDPLPIGFEIQFGSLNFQATGNGYLMRITNRDELHHTILGRPCCAKFMAVSNYICLKMKMPGPKGVITVGSSIEHAFDYDIECVEHAKALALDEVLVATMEKLVNEDLDSTAKHAGNFEGC
jgi:hypothetical protein